MPETTDTVATNVIPAIRLTWVTSRLSMPNTNESPEAACCTPNPSEVTKPYPAKLTKGQIHYKNQKNIDREYKKPACFSGYLSLNHTK